MIGVLNPLVDGVSSARRYQRRVWWGDVGGCSPLPAHQHCLLGCPSSALQGEVAANPLPWRSPGVWLGCTQRTPGWAFLLLYKKAVIPQLRIDSFD